MTYFDDIYDYAVDNYYLISTDDAKRIGVPNVELAKLAHRGKLTHVSYGLYRLTRYVPHANDPYAISVAQVGEGAYLYGESVLAMLGLAPTNPNRIFVAVSRRFRGTVANGVVIVDRGSLDASNVVDYDGIPCQRVSLALIACLGSIMPERLKGAAQRAFDEGYLSKKEMESVLEEVKRHETA